MRLSINHIDKIEFLQAYQDAHQSLSKANICSGFAATGLVPYDPSRVLSQLPAKTPTPPSTSQSNQSSWAGKTPYNPYELHRHSDYISKLQSQSTPVSPHRINQAIHQVIKSCEITMQKANLLQHEVGELRTANMKQKRKREMTRSYIATGGALTGAQGKELAQQAEAIPIQGIRGIRGHRA
jgi:hypothetical protein